jgi:rhodanese-related sulfurtransferase
MEEIKNITPDELEGKLDAGEVLEIVDVREDEEVANGMIEGAKHIRMSEIPANLDYFDKEKEYVFVCHSGGRSYNVCHYLQEQGYKVRNMVGGMSHWFGEVIVK